MTLQQLRYAVEIAATGSISKAAKSLFMGQPNLSKSIKELEAEIGITLFSRTAKGVVATQAGRDFLGYARNILAQMNSLEARYLPEEKQTSRLCVSVPRASYISRAFSRYAGTLGLSSTSAPLALQYHEAGVLAVLQDVANGEVALGIARYQVQHAGYFESMLQEKALRGEILWEYSMVVAMHETHPLAGLAEVPYRLLAEYPQIVQGEPMPVLPTDADAYTGAINLPQSGQITVFDRASQMDILQNVRGAYIWCSPLPFETLMRHTLVQKPCANASQYRDVLVCRRAEVLTQTEADFITALRQEISQLVQP